MTQEQKNYLNNLRDDFNSTINAIRSDFVDERALSDSGYMSDSFTEYADQVNETIKED